MFHEDRVVAMGFNLLIERKEDEDEEDVSALEWHNTAAAMAEKEGGEVAWRWRNYQFLHLQHLGQRVARRWGAAYTLHLSGLSLDR